MNGKYLTYEEYSELGGNLSEDAFSNLIHKVDAKLDYYTFNRLSGFEIIPTEVKNCEVELLRMFDNSTSSSKKQGLTSYSNGIETFGWQSDSDTRKEFNASIYEVIKEFLVGYPQLLDRRVYSENINYTS